MRLSQTLFVALISIVVSACSAGVVNSGDTERQGAVARKASVKGDFNGDGRADILWRYTDGRVNIWNSNIPGSTFPFSFQDLGVIDNGWVIRQVGDFNGDGRADILWLELQEGATLADALRESGLLAGLSVETADALKPGIWGRVAALDTRLREGDRVELTRGLLVDPKEARRQRYRRDGVRGKARSAKR